MSHLKNVCFFNVAVIGTNSPEAQKEHPTPKQLFL